MNRFKQKNEWVTEELENGSLVITEYNGIAATVIVPAELNGKVVSVIGEEAFMENQRLEEIWISEGISQICSMALYSCSKLHTVHLPSTLEVVNSGVFGACDHLVNFDIADENKVFAVHNGMLFDKQCKSIIASSKALSGPILLPNETIGISCSAFSGCSKVTEFLLPDGLVWIEDSAFEGCKIKSILIPESVRYIHESAFFECWDLREVSMPIQCKIFKPVPGLDDKEIDIVFRNQVDLV